MGLFEEALDGLREMAKAEGNASKLADKLGESPSLFSRWFDGTRKPNWSKLSVVLEKVGVKLQFPSKGQILTTVTDPLAQRIEILVGTMRKAGVADLEILRAVRSMLDSEIAKQSSYGLKEDGGGYGKAAEDPAQYGHGGGEGK